MKVRKQIYIEPSQERQLKRLARKSGVPEAEIIRQALDRHIRECELARARSQAWEEERAFIRKWMEKGPVTGGRSWRREDLYER